MIIARQALSVAGLCLVLLCAGCAAWAPPSVWGSSSVPPSRLALAPTGPVEPSSPTSPPLPTIPAISTEAEDFVCLDGSRLRVSYANGRDAVSVSLDGARPISMRRQDEDGLTAYRGGDMVLRRSGVRVALAGGAAPVTVRSGDTLGSIALRAYGDRARAADIARLNGIENPDLIFPGQVLQLAHVERRCRRAFLQDASYVEGDPVPPSPLSRRRFSPPSERQPDQRRVRATASDPY